MTRGRALRLVHALERQAHVREVQVLNGMEADLRRLEQKREEAGGVLMGALAEAADGGPLSLLGTITERSRERLRGIDARMAVEAARIRTQRDLARTHATAAKRYETIIERRAEAARERDERRAWNRWLDGVAGRGRAP